MRKSRGADLAHLTTLPPDQARARRMIHDAVESEVAIARDVGASRREEHRSIYGTASPDDAKALHEEGIMLADPTRALDRDRRR
jgi:hypothetical protein